MLLHLPCANFFITLLSKIHKAQCRLGMHELQHKLREWKRLVVTRHSDRNYIQNLKDQIRVWKTESKAKQAQLVGVQQQCEQDWKLVSQNIENKDCARSNYGDEIIQALAQDLMAMKISPNDNVLQGEVLKLKGELEQVQQEKLELQKELESAGALQRDIPKLKEELVQARQDKLELQKQLELVEEKWFDLTDERVKAWEQVSELKDEVKDLHINIQEYARRELKSG
jgi:chromosome segregation ATPase